MQDAMSMQVKLSPRQSVGGRREEEGGLDVGRVGEKKTIV